MEYYFRRNYRGKLKAVIFDWAGTTIDYGCMAPTVAFMELFKSEGLPISIAEARAPMGTYKKDHIRQILQMASVRNRWREIYAGYPGEQDVERMYRNFVPAQMTCLTAYADLIPGTLETVAECRERGMKIGSTTGYTQEMMVVLLDESKKRGYEPDSTICADQVRAGRPEPWMCLQNAYNLGVFPMEASVKVDDTIPGIEEGLNAGMWTVGVTKSGNEVGLSQAEIEDIPPQELNDMLIKASRKMAAAGAHFIIESIAELPPVLDEIDRHLHAGEKP